MPKIRVLVVDDAVVMRKMITEVLSSDPQIEVVGIAANGKIALQKIPQVNPDLITLDVEMPEMDGLQTLRELRKTYPKLPVIMFSTLTQRGAATTLDALAAGASDYVTKPANVGSITEGLKRLTEDLVPKIKGLCRGLIPKQAQPSDGATAFVRRVAEKSPTAPPVVSKVAALTIGTSTGGPNALAELFRDFAAPVTVPVFIVQHMPPMFTKMLAERLDGLKCALRFHEGEEGQAVEPGHAYIAPGGKHMEVQSVGGRRTLRLHEGPPENSCRPAVDVLFRSVVAIYNSQVLGVIMTGMGQDGLRGCQLIREHHGQVLAQDEASSVVWGMPGYVAQAGLAEKVLPLPQLAGEIYRRLKG